MDDKTTVIVGLGIPGIDLDGFIQILDGPVIVALVIISNSPVVLGHIKAGVDLQSFIKVLDGLIIIAFETVGISPVGEGMDISWVDF